MPRILLLIVLCSLDTLALASGPNVHSLLPQDTSNARYASDLVGTDASDRLYAARVLLRRIRTAWRMSTKDDDSIEVLEARQTLNEFDEIVAPRCLRMLSKSNTAKPCIQILGMLETEAALDPMRQQLGSAGWCQARLLRRAIGQIEGSQ
jgi:hypothetical protein